MCDTFNCDCLLHTTFYFYPYPIDLFLNQMQLSCSNFVLFIVKSHHRVTQRWVSQENASKRAKFCCFCLCNYRLK